MTPREEIHQLIDQLDDDELQPALHAAVDTLPDDLIPTALSRMRAMRERLPMYPSELLANWSVQRHDLGA